ncbi:MAG: DUF1667 domain-containing protein [Angelakisella sp.]
MTNVICIVCPKGCHLSVDEQNGYAVTGFGCERGKEYGKKELVNPTRVITSTVKLTGGIHPRCPVKTNGDIPKGDIPAAMAMLDKLEFKSPIHVGDVVAKDICGTGVDWVATRTM